MKKSLLFIFLFLIFPLSVFADGANLKCQNNDSKQVVCNIIGTSDNTINEISFKIIKTENISVAKLSPGDNFKIISNDNDNILITGKNTTNEFKIGEITFDIQAEESGYIGLDSVKYKNSENDEIKINNIKKSIPLNNNDSLLRNIIIDNYLINFKEDTYEYTLRLKDEDSLNILPIPEESDTKYEIKNNHDLINDSVIEIVTTSNTNMSSTYKIRIIKDIPVDTQYYLYIYIGIISLIVIINIVRLISSSKKK